MTYREAPFKEKRDFDQIMVDLRRVARMVGGGRRFRFRATIVIGDRKGQVGEGTAKGIDVAAAIEKAVNQAKKHLIKIKIEKGTIPHEIRMKHGAAKILLKPASPGTGLIAGGPVRAVLELAGFRNILSKILGSKNKINNIRATLKALKRFEITEKSRSIRISPDRGKDVKINKEEKNADTRVKS